MSDYVPAIRRRGPILNGPTALPATTEMLVLDASGNITTQSIPVASFGALTGSPSDNAALSSALAGKVSLAGDTMTGNLGVLSRLTFGGDTYWERVSSTRLDLIQSGASRSVISNGEATFTGRVSLTDFNPNSADVHFRRNSTGPSAEIRAAGGLRVRDAAGSAFAAITCGAITANTQSSQPNASVRLESNPVTVSTTQQSGVGFYYSSTGARMGGMSLDNSGILQIQATQGSGVGTLLEMSPSTARLRVRPADGVGFGSVECGAITATGTLTHGFQTLVANPSTVDITTGLARMVKNSSSGELRLWANDGGSMKSTLLS